MIGRRGAGAARIGAAAAVLVASSATALLSARQAAPVLSLDAAVSLAREQNRTLQAQRIDVEKASERLTAFSTRKLPAFDVNVTTGSLLTPLDFRFNQGVFGTIPPIGPIPAADTVIRTDPQLLSVVFASVRQPLTQLRRIDFGAKAIALSRDVAAEQVRGREAEIAVGVKKLYYGIVQAEAGLRAREDSVRLHRELVRVVEQYAKERAVLPSDVLSMRAALMKEEHQLTAVRNAATGYREQLNALVGRGLDEPFEVEPLQPSTVTDDDLREAESRAVANRSEVRISRMQSEQADFDLRATRKPFTPEVSVAFNYAGFYGFEVLPRHAALLGALVTWEPWDWGRARAERQEKNLVRSQAELAARETEALVRVDVRARFRAVQEAFDLVQVTTAARDAAREQFRIATERLREQAALEREVLEAQARLAQADFDCQQALAGYWTARAEFERARGDL